MYAAVDSFNFLDQSIIFLICLPINLPSALEKQTEHPLPVTAEIGGRTGDRNISRLLNFLDLITILESPTNISLYLGDTQTR